MEKKRIGKQIENLNELTGKCPTCGTQLTAETVEKLDEELNEEWDKADKKELECKKYLGKVEHKYKKEVEKLNNLAGEYKKWETV